MQTLKVYSIRDQKGEAFDFPFPQRTHGEAERTFKTLVNDPKTRIGVNPEDYDLYFLGEFNDDSGKMDLLPSPQHLVKGMQLKDTVQ